MAKREQIEVIHSSWTIKSTMIQVLTKPIFLSFQNQRMWGTIHSGIAVEKCNYSSEFSSLAWSHNLFASYQLYFPNAWKT